MEKIMISLEHFEKIKCRYGSQASWAVWGKRGERPKDGMDDLSMFEGLKLKNTLEQIHTKYILVGLNISTSSIRNKLQNFHGKNGEVYKVRFALEGTKLWGSYMTDILKDFPESKAVNVERFLMSEEGQEREKINIKTFNEEMEYVQGINSHFIAFGDTVFNLLNKYYKNSNQITKIPHYGYRVPKEVYRCMLHTIIEQID